MTTWESTDNVEVMDNVTVTSDAAYERVTSDEHFEEERNWGYLQQNTSWLVQEIPNISFLDIADTMLESKKTLYNRKNWNIVIWKAWRSIEAQPQDLARLVSNDKYIHVGDTNDYIIPFEDIEIPSWEDEINIKTFEFKNNWIEVLIPWVYRISYWWQINPWNTTYFRIWMRRNGNYITSDDYDNVNGFWSIISWWRSISLKCAEWDVLDMFVFSQWDNPEVYLSYQNARFTYLEIQYIQQVL